MSVLAYPPHFPNSDEEILRYCVKKCGYIAATEDQQFFALGCLFCAEKFLYFDAYILHMQTEHHANGWNDSGNDAMCYSTSNNAMNAPNGYSNGPNEAEDITESDAALLAPQMVMVKQELPDEEAHQTRNTYPMSAGHVNASDDPYFKREQRHEMASTDDPVLYGNESYGNNDDFSGDGYYDDEDDQQQISSKSSKDDDDFDEDDDNNYDDLVEESLLTESGSGSGLAMHIKDRKMIQFVIDSYKRNPYLWDHRNPHFRDRKRRQKFLDWMLAEFKRRFNVTLARDAITRKWDNLRTVYKRECNRMSLERTNVSTLWYFKELHFLNRLYGGNQKMNEAVVKETIYRRRFSALWNDLSTSRLLSMVHTYPCFYDKTHPDYRSKEKRGEALQIMANELQKMIDVSTIQISKRISQLRFDYSKQKQERLHCEQNNRAFVPSYSYYEQMLFMDGDISPFKCEFCEMILQTTRDMETHLVVHQTPSHNGYICPECEAVFPDIEQFKRHKLSQHPMTPLPLTPPQSTLKEPRFFCDLCTASFREKVNYDEHMRRHNDELLLPGLADVSFDTSVASGANEITTTSAVATNNTEHPFICDSCGKSFASRAELVEHSKQHVGSGGSGERSFRCDFPNCGRAYVLRQSYLEHMRLHYSNDGCKCDICGKTFKSSKNLQNHKQIHDAVKRYVCKICGSAFAQAAGLYLHKRRHTRNPDGNVDRHRGRSSY